MNAAYDNWKSDNGEPVHTTPEQEQHELCDEIESSVFLENACHEAEKILGGTFEADELSTRICCGVILARTSIGFEFEASSEHIANTILIAALRELADQIEKEKL